MTRVRSTPIDSAQWPDDPRTRRYRPGAHTIAAWIIRCSMAGLVWTGGVFTTWLLVASLAEQTPDTLTVAAFIGSELIWIAAALQAVFTGLESAIWRGRNANVLTWFVLAIDTLVNAGGLWLWLRNLPQTNVSTMLSETLGIAPVGAGLFGLALAIGAALAYAPEAIIRQR